MSFSVISFVGWAIVMLLMLGGIGWASRKSKRIEDAAESTASRCLPEIGKIAEEKHEARFGRAPTNAPGVTEDAPHSWYPEAKKKIQNHA